MIMPGDVVQACLESRAFSMFLGIILLELGIAHWQKRDFSWKQWFYTVLIVIGVRMALKDI